MAASLARVGWSQWLALLVVVPLAGYVFLAMLAWRALPMAGYSRWGILLLLVPVLNVFLLFWLAFARWPRYQP